MRWKAKLIFDISKRTSDNLNKFERTYRWKFCEIFWLPFISSILERAWLQGIQRQLILKLEKMIVIAKMYF